MSGRSMSLTPDVQLKREAKLLTVIGLSTKHADCDYIYVISNTFVTYDNVFELIRKISLTCILFLIYILRHHKSPVPIGLDAKVCLIRH